MRETALTALLDAYESEENLSPLHAFTTRFQSRFAELVYDKSEAVAVKGIQLVTLLVKAEEMPQEQVGSPVTSRHCHCARLLCYSPSYVDSSAVELHPAANIDTRRPSHRDCAVTSGAFHHSQQRLRHDHVVQARDLYRLLVEDSTAIRHAAAELAAGMLEPQGQRFLAQVGSVCIPLHEVPFLPWGSSLTRLAVPLLQHWRLIPLVAADCVHPFLQLNIKTPDGTSILKYVLAA